MAKPDEIAYVDTLAHSLGVPLSDVHAFLRRKPWSDPDRWRYLMDLAQLLAALPPAPATLLDLGCGSGWTSEAFALAGYDVLGIDLAPAMIALAQERCRPELRLAFRAWDYEQPLAEGSFDVVVSYDALHHAEAERAVLRAVFTMLKPGGHFLSIEPGTGHGDAPASQDAVQKFGTTEKDMPFHHQAALLREVGFTEVRQYLRLSQLAMHPVQIDASTQTNAWAALLQQTTAHGLTSLLVAPKPIKRRWWSR